MSKRTTQPEVSRAVKTHDLILPAERVSASSASPQFSLKIESPAQACGVFNPGDFAIFERIKPKSVEARQYLVIERFGVPFIMKAVPHRDGGFVLVPDMPRPLRGDRLRLNGRPRGYRIAGRIVGRYQHM